MIVRPLLSREVLGVNQTLERRTSFNILMDFFIIEIQMRSHGMKWVNTRM